MVRVRSMFVGAYVAGWICSQDCLFHFLCRYVNGVQYSRTLEAWLVKHDVHRRKVLKLFQEAYGTEQAFIWFNRWRVFYIACSELFGYKDGHEWGVGHFLFQKTG